MYRFLIVSMGYLNPTFTNAFSKRLVDDLDDVRLDRIVRLVENDGYPERYLMCFRDDARRQPSASTA